MKFLFILLAAVITLSAAERKDTLTIIDCDTIKIERILKDTTIVIKQDTLKTEQVIKPEKIKKIKKEK